MVVVDHVLDYPANYPPPLLPPGGCDLTRGSLCRLSCLSPLCNATFSDPKLLRSNSDSVIHIGVSLKIINKNNNREEEEDFESGFKADIRNLFGALLALSTGATQHWIILTDRRSVQSVNRVLRAAVTSHLTSNIIRTYKGREEKLITLL